nr:MAG TPA: hypothetical protein [Caudoviricetes sp.]
MRQMLLNMCYERKKAAPAIAGAAGNYSGSLSDHGSHPLIQADGLGQQKAEIVRAAALPGFPVFQRAPGDAVMECKLDLREPGVLPDFPDGEVGHIPDSADNVHAFRRDLHCIRRVLPDVGQAPIGHISVTVIDGESIREKCEKLFVSHMSFLHIVFLLAEFAVKPFDPLGYFGADTVLLCNLCLTKTEFFSITFRGAGDGGASGLDHSTANYAYFHTVSALRAARVVKSVLFIPLLGLLPIYCTDSFRGAVFTVFLQAARHDVLFPAYDTLVNAAERALGAGLAPGGAALTLTLCPAVRAIPGARAAVKGDAALTAGTRAESSCADSSDAIITFGLIRASHKQLPAGDALFQPHIALHRLRPVGRAGQFFCDSVGDLLHGGGFADGADLEYVAVVVLRPAVLAEGIMILRPDFAGGAIIEEFDIFPGVVAAQVLGVAGSSSQTSHFVTILINLCHNIYLLGCCPLLFTCL